MSSAQHKKKTESKYVSCFADSRPDVDITFRDVLLSRPTDHYLVGVDNFSLTNTSLSMIEPRAGNFDALIRMVRNPSTAYTTHLDAVPASEVDLDTALQDGQAKDLKDLYIVPEANVHDFNLSISSTTVFLNVNQLVTALLQLASDVNRFMNTGGAAGNTFEVPYTPGDNTTHEHLRFDLTTDGRLKIMGSPAFWACFSIEIPSVQNQYGFYGPHQTEDEELVQYTRLRRILSVHPETGKKHYNKILVTRFQRSLARQFGETEQDYAIRVPIDTAFNGRTIHGTTPKVRVVKSIPDLTNGGGAYNTGNDNAILLWNSIEIPFRACINSTMERRIALELGCSLPIKNSPMIDHQKESPDFVLGRWIWRSDPRVQSNMQGKNQRFEGSMPTCVEYQGTQDRITYHELQAQAKIQTLRLRLFARIRSFDEINETWGMRVIELPAQATDWWHTRLHFISKD